MKTKTWEKMILKEKKLAYSIAIKSGQVKDSFAGFSKTMLGSSFYTRTGLPYEII